MLILIGLFCHMNRSLLPYNRALLTLTHISGANSKRSIYVHATTLFVLYMYMLTTLFSPLAICGEGEYHFSVHLLFAARASISGAIRIASGLKSVVSIYI